MSQSPHRLTPELQRTICTYIRSGSFPHIAAEAAGVPRDVFERWLRHGQNRAPRRQYRLLYEGVRQAQAEVRLFAECKAFQKDPLTWLKSGPGKETTDDPGWTLPIRALFSRESETVSLLLRQEVQELLARLMEVLAPYPEARAALAAALTGTTDQPGTDTPGSPEKP